jgi:hypothetical protein
MNKRYSPLNNDLLSFFVHPATEIATGKLKHSSYKQGWSEVSGLKRAILCMQIENVYFQMECTTLLPAFYTFIGYLTTMNCDNQK